MEWDRTERLLNGKFWTNRISNKWISKNHWFCQESEKALLAIKFFSEQRNFIKTSNFNKGPKVHSIETNRIDSNIWKFFLHAVRATGLITMCVLFAETFCPLWEAIFAIFARAYVYNTCRTVHTVCIPLSFPFLPLLTFLYCRKDFFVSERMNEKMMRANGQNY